MTYTHTITGTASAVCNLHNVLLLSSGGIGLQHMSCHPMSPPRPAGACHTDLQRLVKLLVVCRANPDTTRSAAAAYDCTLVQSHPNHPEQDDRIYASNQAVQVEARKRFQELGAGGSLYHRSAQTFVTPDFIAVLIRNELRRRGVTLFDAAQGRGDSIEGMLHTMGSGEMILKKLKAEVL